MTSELDLEQLEKVARLATGAAEPSDWQADVYTVVKSLAAFKGQTTGSVDRLIECDGVYGTMDGRVATHIATFGPPTALALVAEVRELRAKVERVREVHEPIDALLNPGRHERVVKVCIGCGTDDGNWQRYPCPTIKALEEEA